MKNGSLEIAFDVKHTIKYFFIRMLAGLFRGLRLARQALAGFVHILGFPFVVFGRACFTLIVLPSYRLILFGRRLIFKVLTPTKNKILFVFAHRYVVHLVIFGLVAATSIFNLKNYALRAEAFGERSLLHALMAGDEESERVEEAVELEVTEEEVYSYFGIGAVSATSEISEIDRSGELIATQSGSALVKPNVMEGGTSLAPRTKVEKYIVEDGDTVDAIAKKHRVSVATVLSANNLTLRSLIHAGDELVILPFSGARHLVKSGDTLQSIATKYGVEVDEVIKANKLMATAKLALGEEILIPGGTPPAPIVAVKPRGPGQGRTTTAAPVEKLFKEPVKPLASAATGKYVWPTSGRLITQYYRYRHTGVDIDGQIGSAIYATADGVVEFAGWATGYGLSIVVNHGNGVWSRYGHNSKIYMKIGDSVKQGQTIALMGSTGKSTGSHLHFEILTGPRAYKNPLKYIK